MEYALTPKYCDNNSILLVNQTGVLRKLYCPFMVYSRIDKGNLKSGLQVWVEEVAVNAQDELSYYILGRYYSFHLFELKISF